MTRAKKKGPSQLSRRVTKGDKAYTAEEIKSLTYVSVIGIFACSKYVDPLKAHALAVHVLNNLPPMTFFGLSPTEMKALTVLLRETNGLYRQYTSWVAMRNYTPGKKTGGIISIES